MKRTNALRARPKRAGKGVEKLRYWMGEELGPYPEPAEILRATTDRPNAKISLQLFSLTAAKFPIDPSFVLHSQKRPPLNISWLSVTIVCYMLDGQANKPFPLATGTISPI